MSHATRSPLLRCVAIALGFTLLGSAAASAASLDDIRKRGTIRIAVANEIPYGFMGLDGQANGAGPDVARELVKQLGIDNIEWVPTSFSSLIPGLQADRFDMVAAEMAILPQRCQQVLFSEPNTSYGEGLLVAKGNPDNLHSYQDFVDSDKRIAIMAGADQLEMLQALGVDANRMVTIANNADAISTISTGRASAYAATSLTVGELAGKSRQVEAAQGFQDPVIDGTPVRSWGGFTFAQTSTDLRDAINSQLAGFKATDQWKAILTQYGFSAEDATASFDQTTMALCQG